METIVERPAALDVHKEQVTACVRVPGRRGREQHVAEFKTTVQGLLALRDWLKAHAATHVAMEASGVYWKPPWAILEGVRREASLALIAEWVRRNPSHVWAAAYLPADTDG